MGNLRQKPEIVDVLVGDGLNGGKAPRIRVGPEEMSESLLDDEIFFDGFEMADEGSIGHLAIFRFEEWEEPGLDGKPRHLDGAAGFRTPTKRARHVDVNVARAAHAHGFVDLVLE